MRDHWVVVGVGVLLNLKVLLTDALLVVQKRPVRPHPEPEVVAEGEVVRRYGDDPRGAYHTLGGEPHELMELLSILGASDTAPQHKDHGIDPWDRRPARKTACG